MRLAFLVCSIYKWSGRRNQTSEYRGINIDDRNVSILLYADDIILISENEVSVSNYAADIWGYMDFQCCKKYLK